MNIRIEIVCVSADGREQRRQLSGFERQELAMETLGMSLSESKALLQGVQDFMVAQQVSENLEQRRACLHCGRRHTTKGTGSTLVKTLFGSVNVPNPRWNRCACQTEGPNTFRPTATWLQGRTSIEMLYLESKWASLIPFAKVADLLTEVLPIADSINHMKVSASSSRRRRSGLSGNWAKSGSSMSTKARKKIGSNNRFRTVRSQLASMAATFVRRINRGVLK